MILKQISAGGLRGRPFQYNLGTLSVFVGANMSGKTRVLDAIRLIFLGYIPGKDRTNPGIFKTASGPSLNVAALIDDPEHGTLSLERAWMQKGDGTISAQKSIPGTFPPVPLIMFDAEDYFSRTEAGRLQMMFERLNLDDIHISARIGKVAQALEAAGLQQAKDLLNTRQYSPAPNDNFQAWLERALASMKEVAKAENDTAKRMEQTVHGLTELAMQNPTALPDETQVRTAIEENIALLETAHQNLGVAKQAMRDNGATAQRVATLEKGIEDRRNRAVELPTLEATLAQLQADLDRHNGKAQAIPSLRQKRDMFTAEVAGHKATMASATTELQRIDAQEQEIIGQKCCPTCGANKPTWKDKARAMFEDQRKPIRDKYTVSEEARGQASEQLEQAARELLMAEGAGAAANSTATSISQQQAKITTVKAAIQIMEQWQGELDQLRAQGHGNSEELAESLVHAEQEVDGRRTNLQTAEAQLRAIEGARADSQKLETAQKQREEARARAVQITEGARVLQENRDSLMLDAFKPLLATANLFAAGILKTPLEYRKGELGRADENNAGRWISQTYFSGLESATMHCAICAALGSQSPVRLVLLDELGRLDSVYKQRFLQNAVRAIENGVIDQLVAVDVASTDEEVINTEAQAQQKAVPVTIIRVQ